MGSLSVKMARRYFRNKDVPLTTGPPIPENGAPRNLRGPYFFGSKAFSLAEMLVVLSLIGIITSIAVPLLLGAIREQKLEEAADTLVSVFDSARGIAMQHNTYARVLLDTAVQSVTIEYYDPAVTQWVQSSPPVNLPNGVIFATVTFENLIAIFGPYGSLVKGGSIVIQDVRGNQIELEAVVANGRLRISGE